MLNAVMMMGRLVEDPVSYQTEGKALTIVRYRIAVERDYKQDGKRPVDYFLCKAYADVAEFAKEYFRQGDTIVVSGKLYTWPYKKAGEEREHIYSTIQVQTHYLAKKKTDNARTRVQQPASGAVCMLEPCKEEELPPLPPFFDDGEPYESIYIGYKPSHVK